ncbi:unnamed protein product [Lactuca saligna]|uniref:Uncharacterized protein n=1 Tax=Lactuca saligna TaxID=75948 RepID=A0AA36EKQ4_LACSI|nr:unnamed protein product [Lactuca saligna]
MSLRPKLGYNYSLHCTTRDPNNDALLQCHCVGYKYFTGVIGKCLGHKTHSLYQLNPFEQRIVYVMTCKKGLVVPQLFFDQLVECITGNKRPTYVPYPLRLALIMTPTKEGYNVNHIVSIELPFLSSKTINAKSIKEDTHLDEVDDEGNDEDEEDDVDDE